MARATVSPQCKDIFDKMPNIVGLPEEYREINTFPRSPDQWELAMERPMNYYNQLPHVSSRRVISRDCFTMAQLQHHRSAPVHCEVKLLLHLFAEEQQSTNPAYSYVGLSKLSCTSDRSPLRQAFHKLLPSLLPNRYRGYQENKR